MFEGDALFFASSIWPHLVFAFFGHDAPREDRRTPYRSRFQTGHRQNAPWSEHETAPSRGKQKDVAYRVPVVTHFVIRPQSILPHDPLDNWCPLGEIIYPLGSPFFYFFISGDK